MKYRKKPIIVEATQWFKNGDHPEDYAEGVEGYENRIIREYSPQYCKEHNFEGRVVRYFRHPGISGQWLCQECGLTFHVHGWIDTKEGGHRVCPGDFIITGIEGERYPCKARIFMETYEAVESASHSQGIGPIFS